MGLMAAEPSHPHAEDGYSVAYQCLINTLPYIVVFNLERLQIIFVFHKSVPSSVSPMGSSTVIGRKNESKIILVVLLQINWDIPNLVFNAKAFRIINSFHTQ